MSFHVGQKVLCVDDSDPSDARKRFGGHWCPHGPRRGMVYTVRDIIPHDITGEPYLRVHEIINPPRNFQQGIVEAAFKGSRFRPITERKTDISIFKRMLTPSELKKAKRELV